MGRMLIVLIVLLLRAPVGETPQLVPGWVALTGEWMVDNGVVMSSEGRMGCDHTPGKRVMLSCNLVVKKWGSRKLHGSYVQLCWGTGTGEMPPLPQEIRHRFRITRRTISGGTTAEIDEEFEVHQYSASAGKVIPVRAYIMPAGIQVMVGPERVMVKYHLTVPVIDFVQIQVCNAEVAISDLKMK